MSKQKDKKKRDRLYKFMSQFETEQVAMEYIESLRWENGRTCPRCESKETTQASHKTMPYWCKPCRKYFSVKTGTLMEDSNIKYKKWMMAVYLLSTSIKRVSSYKLGSDIELQQRSAWFLNNRIRTSWANNTSYLFEYEVEIDDKEENKSKKT